MAFNPFLDFEIDVSSKIMAKLDKPGVVRRKLKRVRQSFTMIEGAGVMGSFPSCQAASSVPWSAAPDWRSLTTNLLHFALTNSVNSLLLFRPESMRQVRADAPPGQHALIRRARGIGRNGIDTSARTT